MRIKNTVLRNNQKTRRIATFILTAGMLLTAPMTVFAQSEESQSENIKYATGVTEGMCNAGFWSERATNADTILMTKDEITALNKEMLNTQGTHMTDLENLSTEYDGTAVKKSLAGISTPTSTFYVNGEKLENKEAYFQSMKDNIANAETTTNDTVKYAVAVEYADMKSWPTADVLGYSKSDPDDEMQSASLCVNEPFVVMAVTADGKFCWGYSDNCCGWVEADHLAICSSKDEWLDSWKVDINEDNYVVVTTNKITLEDSISDKSTAKVTLTLGTVLKEVPEDEIPVNIGERGTWNNYVVYLPTRDDNGNYVKKPALISMHYNVSEGYLNLTQANVMNVAFECLGDRYGWGGMLTSPDCSMYARTIYKCFGLEIPRNTTWQQKIPGHWTDISKLTDEEKIELLKKTPVGSILYMSGHEVVYTGIYNDCAYTISATGSLADSIEETVVISQNNIILNPLTVKRRNGTTWLHNMTGLVTFGEVGPVELDNCTIEMTADVSYVYSGEELKPEIVVKDGDTILKENESYTLTYSSNVDAGEATVVITGIGDYTGTIERNFTIQKAAPYQVETSDYNGKYDGKPHTITLENVRENSIITYRTSQDGEWTSEAPVRTEVGTTEVYYQITNPNYETIYGKQSITITGDDKDSSNESDNENKDKTDNGSGSNNENTNDNNGGGSNNENINDNNGEGSNNENINDNNGGGNNNENINDNNGGGNNNENIKDNNGGSSNNEIINNNAGSNTTTMLNGKSSETNTQAKSATAGFAKSTDVKTGDMEPSASVYVGIMLICLTTMALVIRKKQGGF